MQAFTTSALWIYCRGCWNALFYCGLESYLKQILFRGAAESYYANLCRPDNVFTLRSVAPSLPAPTGQIVSLEDSTGATTSQNVVSPSVETRSVELGFTPANNFVGSSHVS